jgi:hypothetical protein
MVQVSPFCGLPSEDANVDLQQFLKMCNTIVSRTSFPRLSSSICFPFPLWERQNSGSTRTRKLLTYQVGAPLCSSLSYFPWAKPMLLGEGSLISSKLRWNPFWRRGRGYKSTSKPVPTIGWRTSWCSKTSTTS